MTHSKCYVKIGRGEIRFRHPILFLKKLWYLEVRDQRELFGDYLVGLRRFRLKMDLSEPFFFLRRNISEKKLMPS